MNQGSMLYCLHGTVYNVGFAAVGRTTLYLALLLQVGANILLR